MKIVFVNTVNMDFQLLEMVKQRSEEMKKAPFNLTSLVEYGEHLDSLFPDRNVLQHLNNPNEIIFTAFYHDYIFKSKDNFKIFMYLMTEAMEREYTFILVSYNKFTERPLDELMGFIKDRYGIDSYLVNEYDDIAKETLEDSNFKTIEQRRQFMADSEIYTKLIGGIVKINDKDIKDAQEDRKILEELYNEQIISNGSICSTI